MPSVKGAVSISKSFLDNLSKFFETFFWGVFRSLMRIMTLAIASGAPGAQGGRCRRHLQEFLDNLRKIFRNFFLGGF